MNKKITKIFKISFCSIAIFAMTFPFQALAFSYPSPVQAMNQIMGDLGVNKSEIKKDVKIMNVANYKKQPPQVMLTFDPSNPAPAQKLTVAATPLYFMNDSKNLYYTWYLKPSGCTDKHDKNYDYKKECSVNILELHTVYEVLILM